MPALPHFIQIALPADLASKLESVFLVLYAKKHAKCRIDNRALGLKSGKLLRFCNELIVDFNVGTHDGTLVYR